MNNIFNKKYFEDVKWIINENLKDLEEWSVHNKDFKLEKIQELRKALKKI